MTKNIHIVAGGPKELIPDLSAYKEERTVWIGVDKGILFIIQAGIAPNLAVGDFDSIHDGEWALIEESVPFLRKFQPEKDETDMELALMSALEENPSTIKIFGGTGGRLDHFLANAMMIGSFKQRYPEVAFELIDVQNIMSVFLPGVYQIQQDDQKKFISFVPLFSDTVGLTLKGFKYPLTDRYVPVGSSLCISNELIQETGHFSFEKGILMMVRSKD